MTTLGDLSLTIGAGAVSALAITPIMTVLDLGILRAQLDRTSLRQSIRTTYKELLSGRVKVNPAFNIMLGAYTATYVTANVVRLGLRDAEYNPVIPVTVATFGVNAAAIALKDRAYSLLLTGSKSFPTSSLGLFAARDALTFSAAFIGKEKLRDWMIREKRIDARVADSTSTFGVLMFAQFVSTPLHVLAVDQFQRPLAGMASRIKVMKEVFWSVTAGRMARVIPAFGIAAYINDQFREKIDMRIEDRLDLLAEVQSMQSLMEAGAGTAMAAAPAAALAVSSPSPAVSSSPAPVAAAAPVQEVTPAAPKKATRLARRTTVR